MTLVLDMQIQSNGGAAYQKFMLGLNGFFVDMTVNDW